MLDGSNLDAHRTDLLLKAGAHARIANHQGRGGQIDDRIEIHATKNDSRIGRSRTQDHVDLDTRVQANAGSANQRFEGALFKHVIESDGESANCSTVRKLPD